MYVVRTAAHWHLLMLLYMDKKKDMTAKGLAQILYVYTVLSNKGTKNITYRWYNFKAIHVLLFKIMMRVYFIHMSKDRVDLDYHYRIFITGTKSKITICISQTHTHTHIYICVCNFHLFKLVASSYICSFIY